MSKILTPGQDKLIASLLTSTTIRDAARAAGISEKTAHTYFKDAAFIKAYAGARKSLIEETRHGLTALVATSLQKLQAVLEGDETPDNMRLKAIDMVFARVLDAPAIADPAGEVGQVGMLMVDPDAYALMTTEEKDVLLGLLRGAHERKAEQDKQGVA